MIDLSKIEIVDFHCHPATRSVSNLMNIIDIGALETILPISVTEDMRRAGGESIVKVEVSSEESEKLREKVRSYEKKYNISSLRKNVRRQYMSIPSTRDFIRYVARAFDCEATLERIDEMVSNRIKKDLVGYMRSVLDRENIGMAVLDLFGSKEVVDFPKDRCYWIYRIRRQLYPDWFKERGLTSLSQALDAVEEDMKEAVEKGCSGFKNIEAILRTLEIEGLAEEEARYAFRSLLKAKPSRYRVTGNIPMYEKPEDKKNLRLFQDFLIRHMLILAGKFGLPFLFHTGAEGIPGRYPDLRNSNPTNLYPILVDDEIVKTKIVMLHGSYPYYREAAIMTHMFGNLYIEFSPLVFYHGDLKETLRIFLEFVPAHKILYGSDSFCTPELFGYNAWLIRRILSEVLEDFREKHGWTKEECMQAAEMIMNRNAKEVLGK